MKIKHDFRDMASKVDEGESEDEELTASVKNLGIKRQPPSTVENLVKNTVKSELSKK